MMVCCSLFIHHGFIRTQSTLTHDPVIVSFFFMSQILYLSILFFYFIEESRAHHLFQSPNNITAAPKPQCQPLLSIFLHFFFTLLQVSWMKWRLVFLSARACLNSRTEWKWIKHDHILSHILGGQSQEAEGKGSRKHFLCLVSRVDLKQMKPLLCYHLL